MSVSSSISGEDVFHHNAISVSAHELSSIEISNNRHDKSTSNI